MRQVRLIERVQIIRFQILIQFLLLLQMVLFHRRRLHLGSFSLYCNLVDDAQLVDWRLLGCSAWGVRCSFSYRGRVVVDKGFSIDLRLGLQRLVQSLLLQDFFHLRCDHRDHIRKTVYRFSRLLEVQFAHAICWFLDFLCLVHLIFLSFYDCIKK